MKRHKNLIIGFMSIILMIALIIAVHYISRFFGDNFKNAVEILSNIATAFTTFGVVFACFQLKLTRDISVGQFENQLFAEYRRAIEKFPASAMLGEELTDCELTDLADAFYMYIDLTNEQIHLRMSNKITKETWSIWRDGIRSNLLLPAFKKSWDRIKQSTSSFQELRRFENEGFMSDPICWGRD